MTSGRSAPTERNRVDFATAIKRTTLACRRRKNNRRRTSSRRGQSRPQVHRDGRGQGRPRLFLLRGGFLRARRRADGRGTAARGPRRRDRRLRAPPARLARHPRRGPPGAGSPARRAPRELLLASEGRGLGRRAVRLRYFRHAPALRAAARRRRRAGAAEERARPRAAAERGGPTIRNGDLS